MSFSSDVQLPPFKIRSAKSSLWLGSRLNYFGAALGRPPTRPGKRPAPYVAWLQLLLWGWGQPPREVLRSRCHAINPAIRNRGQMRRSRPSAVEPRLRRPGVLFRNFFPEIGLKPNGRSSANVQSRSFMSRTIPAPIFWNFLPEIGCSGKHGTQPSPPNKWPRSAWRFHRPGRGPAVGPGLGEWLPSFSPSISAHFGQKLPDNGRRTLDGRGDSTKGRPHASKRP
jgi:hypothetical protein